MSTSVQRDDLDALFEALDDWADAPEVEVARSAEATAPRPAPDAPLAPPTPVVAPAQRGGAFGLFGPTLAGRGGATNASAQAEVEALRARLARLTDDFDRLRKRTEREAELTKERANEELLRALLPAFDDLERAASETAAIDAAQIRQGLQIALDGLHRTLERFGLVAFDAEFGGTFDPTLHEAVTASQEDDAQSVTVRAQFRRGYRLHRRLLRPAQVMVVRPRQ
jgi:molecular chaperone GrpE